MAKFKDGAGVEHDLVVRNQGHLEDVQAKHGIDLDTMFMEDVEGLLKFLYTSKRKFCEVLAELCGLTGEAAETMRRSLDVPAFERGREALLEALTDFCPRELQALAKKNIQSIRDALLQLDGSNKDTKLADS